MASPLLGQAVTGVDGIVTAVHAKGFYMQEPNPDADPQTSEGIYVYLGSAPSVSVGDLVDVDGDVSEHNNLTQIENPSVTVSGSGTITSTEVPLPLTALTEYEIYEGMLVVFTQTLTVNDLYNLGNYGSIRLSQGGRLFNPTNVITPGIPAQNLQEANDLRSLLLDDGSSASYPDPIPYPSPALSTTNTLRSGDVVTDLTGVLSYGFGDYRLHPTVTPDFTTGNPRPNVPTDVGGSVQVASFNVLNYFNTFSGCAGGVGGDPEDCRGADDATEFQRQHDKIVTALLEIDADVVGLMEIENDGYGPNSAVADLVDGLNAAGTDTYAFVNPDTATGVTNALGTDAIKVAMIYKTGAVTPTGTTAALNAPAFVDPNDIGDDKNRPALAQSFMDGNGEIFTAVVNHLKSKGSPCGTGDDVPDYEGGNCNGTRTQGVEEMLAWLATDPTDVNDPDVLITGDLNAYAKEDPVTALQDAGYTDLVNHYEGATAYSYVYYGQAGYLDHGLTNATLTPQVTGTTIWHINADEPKALDYNDDEPNDEPGHYDDDPYRASDHDPVIVGLDLASPDLNLTKEVIPTTDVEPGDTLTYTLTLSNSGQMDTMGLLMTDTLPLSTTFGGFITANGATEDSGKVTFSGTVGADSEVGIIYTATVAIDYTLYSETVTNTATYDSDNAGSGQAQAAFSIIGPPALELTKAVMPEMDVDLGDVVTYTLSLANDGNATAVGILLTDTLPSEVAFGDFAMGTNVDADYADGKVTWSGDLPAGLQNIAIVYTATVTTNTDLYGETVTNTATYDSDNAGSGQAQAAFSIIGPPNLDTSAKVSSSASQQIMPSDLVTYTVTLSNTGDVETTVMLTDTLGSYYAVANALDFTETTTNTLTWNGTVGAGSHMTLQFVAQVAPLADLDIGITTLANTVTIDDNINPPFDIADQTPPYVKIEGLYLPLIARNSD